MRDGTGNGDRNFKEPKNERCSEPIAKETKHGTQLHDSGVLPPCIASLEGASPSVNVNAKAAAPTPSRSAFARPARLTMGRQAPGVTNVDQTISPSSATWAPTDQAEIDGNSDPCSESRLRPAMPAEAADAEAHLGRRLSPTPLPQVEGASIDKQDHAGNACGQIGETDDFDQAIAYAMQNVDLTNTLVIVTADHAHTSQILNAQPAYALSTVLKTADGNNMVVSYGTAQEDSRDIDGGYNGGDMEHTGTQLRIAASGPGAQRVIGLTDQTDNFYTIAGALGLATSAESQKALSDNGTVKVSAADGKFTADVDGFNGDAVLGYELKDKNDKTVAASDSSTPLSGVRVKTAQTTPIALDGVTEGSEYKLTVTGRQSGKAVTVDFQAPAANSADKNNGKPGADKNGVIASGKVNNDTKAGPFGAALLGKTGTAVLAAAVAIAMLVAVAMLIKTAKAAKNDR